MAALNDVDVLVSPTSPYPAPLHTALTARFESAEDVRTRFFFRRVYTGCYSLTALPAISIPGGFTSDGLPIGLQLGARLRRRDAVPRRPRLRAGDRLAYPNRTGGPSINRQELTP